MPTAKRKKAEEAGLVGFTWMPFDVIDWLTSPDVLNMTSSEEGLYIRLLAVQWRDGRLPSDPKMLAICVGREERLVRRWLSNYAHLFPICDGNPKYLANHKLWKIAIEKGKIILGEGTEERREEEIREDFIPPAASKSKNLLGVPDKYEDPDGYAAYLKERSDPGCPKCHGDGETIIWQAQPTKAAPDYKIPIGAKLCPCLTEKKPTSPVDDAKCAEVA
jgi:hypothetical protein